MKAVFLMMVRFLIVVKGASPRIARRASRRAVAAGVDDDGDDHVDSLQPSVAMREV
jgi:hypothetical protein